jgi:aminoglycoside 6'-N-acetyltransferase I
MRVRLLEDDDWPAWRRMREALFPGEAPDEYEADMRACRDRTDAAVFVAERPDGAVCGYVEVGTRAYADGCVTSPVGYIEEWFVDPDMRRRGCGRALLAAAESWACDRGYEEVASDARLDNDVSHRAHRRSGYLEVDRVVQFRKPIC